VVLSTSSSDIILTAGYIIKISIGLLAYVFSYYAFNYIDNIRSLNHSMILVVFITVLVIALSNIHGIGESMYETGPSILVGFFHGPNLYQAALSISLVLFYLLLEPQRTKRVAILALTIISTIVLFLLLRRTLIFIVFFGFLFTYYLAKRKISTILITMVFVFILLTILFFYSGNLLEYIQTRHAKVYMISSFLNENRFLEYVYGFNTIITRDFGLLFGSGELFNSEGNYNYIDIYRAMHSDYSRLIFGSGFVGLFFYLYIHLLIFKNGQLFSLLRIGRVSNIYIYKLSRYLVILGLLVGVSGAMAFISFKFIIMVYIGAMHGVLHNKNLEILNNKKVTYECIY